MLAATLLLVAGKLGSEEWHKALPEIAASTQDSDALTQKHRAQLRRVSARREQRHRAEQESQHEDPEPAAAARLRDHDAAGGATGAGVATSACSRSISRRAT